MELALVSNKQGALVRREVAQLGWSGYFTGVVGAGDAARDKPAREAVDLALARCSVSAGRSVWLVGDTDTDMLCAKNAGAVPVLLRARAPVPGEFADAAPEYYFPDCATLARAVIVL